MSLDPEMTFWEHLDELAKRLKKSLFILVIVMMIIMSLPADLTRIYHLDFTNSVTLISSIITKIQSSLLPEGVTLIAFNWMDSFYIYFTFSFVLSFLICLPYIASQIYGFIAPAMYKEEKTSIVAFTGTFVFLFSLGCCYAYYVIIPITFKILYRFVNSTRIMPFYSVKGFFDIIVFSLLGSGLAYSFPLIIYMLVRTDIIQISDLTKVRKELFVGLLVVTAIITPDPTPISMLLLTIPFFLLYEISIVVLKRLMRNRPDWVIEKGLEKSHELLAKVQAQSNPQIN